MQQSLFSVEQWSVTDLTRHIRDRLETDAQLQDVWVKGEISNATRPPSGHLYFTLKDANCALRCVMWRSSVSRLEFALQDGVAVAAHGKISVYETSGQYQLYVDRLVPAGAGALYQEFLRLKDQLEAEGLFAAERKRPIPEYSTRIGVVTSITGAVLHDVIQTLRRRLPMVEAIVAPSAVQGDEAPEQLVQALLAINSVTPRPGVILLVRGGGSMEDLWAFNDPRVVRAIAESKIPIICGVGHETDFTLSDFAADLRAPTPTAAAELATRVTLIDFRARIQANLVQLETAIFDRLEAGRAGVHEAINELGYLSPRRRIETDRQRVDDLGRRAPIALMHRLSLSRSETYGLQRRLLALSPMETLKRGYAVVTRQADGALVSKVAQARGAIDVQVSDGRFAAQVVKDGR